MKSSRPSPVLLLACLTLLAPASAGQKTPATRPATPVTIERITRGTVPLRGVVARVDLTDPRVKLRSLPGGKISKGRWPTTLETVGAVAEREKLDLAINGDFFMAETMGEPEGLFGKKKYLRGANANALGNTVTDGVQWSRAGKPVPMLAVAKDGKVTIVQNQKPPVGSQQVISGNSMLVWNGQVQMTHDEKDQRNPRTAVGLSYDGKTLILLAMDGRSFTSRGLSMGELSAEMKALGAHWAFNLDGGGSTTLVHREGTDLQVLNTPSDGDQRPVVNVLGVQLLAP